MERSGHNWPLGSRRDRPNASWALGERNARPRILRIVLLTLLLTVIAVVAYVVISVSAMIDEIYEPLPTPANGASGGAGARATPVTPGERINILVLGLDDEGWRSDSMMLASLDLENGKVGVVQIPRDTRARLAGKGNLEKIAHAYAYGLPDKEFPAPLRAMKTVEDFLGVNVHYHITLDMAAFTQIIDSVGGVWVDIPFYMEYDDPEQDLYIRLYPGRQKLNGEEALKFARWRKDNDGLGYGDHGRIRAQQQIIQSLMAELFKPSNLPFLVNQAATVSRYVHTTIEPSNLTAFAKLAVTLKGDDVAFATIPGIDVLMWDPLFDQEVAYFLADPQGTQETVDHLVRGIDRGYNGSVRVQVIGDQEPELAAKIVRRLSGQGYDLRESASVTMKVEPGVIRLLEHGTDPNKARVVGRALAEMGYRVDLVRAPESAPRVDVTVLVGPGS